MGGDAPALFMMAEGMGQRFDQFYEAQQRAGMGGAAGFFAALNVAGDMVGVNAVIGGSFRQDLATGAPLSNAEGNAQVIVGAFSLATTFTGTGAAGAAGKAGSATKFAATKPTVAAPRAGVARSTRTVLNPPKPRLVGMADNASASPAESVVNPGYGIRPGTTNNCVNCAFAGDQSLAGNPLGAVPSEFPVDGHAMLGRAFGRSFEATTIEGIMAKLQTAGPGSRGIVLTGNRDSAIMHVFNAVNRNGVVEFIDFQTGCAPEFGELVSFMQTSP